MQINDEGIKTKLALIEQDVSRVNMFLDKLDSAIEKLADVSASIKELLAVHDHKLNTQLIVNNELFELIHDLKKSNHEEHLETKKSIDQLSHRIDTVEKWRYMVVGGATVIGALISFMLSNYT